MNEYLLTILQTLDSESVRFSLLLTARVCVFALILQVLVGIPLAWYLSGRSTPFKSVLENLITFPLIFPPIAMGYLLLLLLGRRSFIGGIFVNDFGIEWVFSFNGVVLAAFIAGLPLVVRPIQSAITALGHEFTDASYTLGRGKFSTFIFVTLPCVNRNVLSSLILGLGRSLGEVGITLMVGGNIVGKTNTLSLEVFNAVYDGNYERATALCLLLVVFSLILFSLVKALGNHRAIIKYGNK